MITNDGGAGDTPEPVEIDDDSALSADDIAWMEREKAGGGSPLIKDTGKSGDRQAPAEETPPDAAAKDAADPDDEDGEEEGEEVVILGKDGKPRANNGQFVSKSHLLRVKEARKADRQRAADAEAKLHKLSGRYELLAEVVGGGKQPDGQASTAKTDNPWDEPDIDPVNDLFAAFEQNKRRAAYERQQREGHVKSVETRENEVKAVQAYVAEVNAFAAKEPAIRDAYNFIIGMLHNELELVGGITDEGERWKLIRQTERDMVQEALANKQSPAQRIWNLAKARGFTPEAKPTGNGKTPQQLAAEKKLMDVNRGMTETRSLSGVGGKPNEGLTMAAIDAMDDDAFAEFYAKMSPAQKAQYLGG